MMKFLTLAGVAVALLAVAPAANADQRDNRRNHGYHDRDHRDNRGWHDRRDHRGWKDRRDHRSAYRHMHRRDFGYWRPHLARYHYHSYGRPIFSDYYYRVPARDRFGRHIVLTVNAYTGAVISVR